MLTSKSPWTYKELKILKNYMNDNEEISIDIVRNLQTSLPNRSTQSINGKMIKMKFYDSMRQDSFRYGSFKTQKLVAWSPEEIKIVTDLFNKNYFRYSMKDIFKKIHILLPHRSIDAIYQETRTLGLKKQLLTKRGTKC